METAPQTPGDSGPQCANCGTVVPADAVRCPNCGASLARSDPVRAAVLRPLPLGTPCAHCGSQLPLGANRCPSCGASVGSGSQGAVTFGQIVAAILVGLLVLPVEACGVTGTWSGIAAAHSNGPDAPYAPAMIGSGVVGLALAAGGIALIVWILRSSPRSRRGP